MAVIWSHIFLYCLDQIGKTLCKKYKESWKYREPQFFGDFIASMGAAILSAPLNQLYNFAVTSNGFMEAGFLEKVALSRAYLTETYLVYEGDSLAGISHTLGRDLFMRCAYIANLYALFGLIERLAVAVWPYLKTLKSRSDR